MSGEAILGTLVGKTVARVVEHDMAGRDAFKETVTWVNTEIQWTDGTSTTFSSWDGEVWDAFEYEDVDEHGEPINPEDES